MNDTRIRHIIRESIYRLLSEEFGEAKDPWASFERTKTTVLKGGDALNFRDGTGRDKKAVDTAIGRPEKVHKKRAVAKTFYDADPYNASQIRRTLRKAWEVPALKQSYGLLSKFTGEFGVNNAQTVICQLYGEKQKETSLGLFTQFNNEYNKLNQFTTDIEGYQQDINSIRSRLCEMPEHLRDLIKIIYLISDRSKWVNKLLRNPQMRKDAGIDFNPKIISGYITSSGLSSRVVYKSKGSAELTELINTLSRLAEYIDMTFTKETGPIDMGSHELGIKTIRR